MQNDLLFLRCVPFVVSLLVCGAFEVKGQGRPNARRSPGQAIKMSFEGSPDFIAPKTETIRDGSELNWKEIFGKWKYHLRSSHKEDYRRAAHPFNAEFMNWDVENEDHNQQIVVAFTCAEGGPSVARDRLYEIMAMGTTMVVGASTHEILKGGPGDMCIVLSFSKKAEARQGKALYSLSFVRDNAAVNLTCSANIDLLPIARAIDQAIQSCPSRKDEKVSR